MNRNLGYFLVFAFALGIAASSCKKGNTLGAVGYPQVEPFPVFDTFDFPTKRYYFYGKFDNHYMKWQDSLRSDWDTMTHDSFSSEAVAGKPWKDWPDYNENIYYNFCAEGEVETCGPSGTHSFYRHQTRFIRPEKPEERIEINFFDCVDLADTNNPYYPLNNLSIFRIGANPFSDTAFGHQGVQIIYTDDRRDRWMTNPGSGQTDDSHITITEFKQRNLGLDTLDTFAFFIVSGEFTGRLYHETSGAEKIVRDARFRARVVPRVP